MKDPDLFRSISRSILSGYVQIGFGRLAMSNLAVSLAALGAPLKVCASLDVPMKTHEGFLGSVKALVTL